MRQWLSALAGVVVGMLTGIALRPKPQSPCEFCGYDGTETKELFESEELNKLLEENE